MQNPRDLQLGGQAALFEELAQPDHRGVSRLVRREEMVGRYAGLNNFGNGGAWCRSDGSLGRKYVIQRERGGPRGSISGVQLMGFNDRPLNTQTPGALRKKVTTGQRCVVLAVGNNLEADHKDGRKDIPRRLEFEDYQPMSKAANDAKRTHCDRCQDTRERFDATQLFYSVGWTVGGREYIGSCVGCYWYDPAAFNAEISKNYQP